MFFIKKRPSIFVAEPREVPETTTLAPISGSLFFESYIIPVIEPSF